MAEVFVGRWRPDRNSYHGADEFFAAFVLVPGLRQQFEAATETQVALNGNVLTAVTQIEGRNPWTHVARLGETVQLALPNLPPMQVNTRLEGDRLVSDVYLAGIPIILMTYVCYVRGNELFNALTANGRTFTCRATRV